MKQFIITDWDSKRYNKTDKIYTLYNNTTIQFISASDPDSLRGYRSDILYYDELTNIDEESFIQLNARCKFKILCSFNPSTDFWIVDYFDEHNSKVIKSNWEDNDFIDLSIKEGLLQQGKKSKNFQSVYVDGEFGAGEAIILENYEIVKDWNESDNYKWRIFGLDFGYTNDPSTLIEVRYFNNKLYVKEHFYSTGMRTEHIVDYLKFANLQNETIIADSANPETIDTIYYAGFERVTGAKKGAGSILYGINKMQQQDFMINKHSKNIIKEFKNYSWIKNKKTGRLLNKAVDKYNHSIDAIRYSLEDKFENTTYDIIVRT